MMFLASESLTIDIVDSLPLASMPPIITAILAILLFVIVCGGFLFTWVLFRELTQQRQRFPQRLRRADSTDLLEEEQLAQVADRLGFKPLNSAPLIIQSNVELFFGECELSNVLVKKVRGGHLVFCNVEQELHQEGSSNRAGWIRVENSTLAMYLADDDILYPPFFVAPNWNPDSRLMPLMTSLAGCKVLQFDDDPDFSHRVQVVTSHQAVPIVKPFLTDRLRKVLRENEELTTRVFQKTIVVNTRLKDESDFGKLRRETSRGTIAKSLRIVCSRPVHIDDWPEFLKSAGQIISAIRRAESKTRADRSSETDIVSGEMFRVGPCYGLVPRRILNRLLDQTPPRTVSPSLRNCICDSFSFWIRLIGFWFFIGPLLLLVPAWSHIPSGERLLPAILTLTASLGVGFPMVALTTWMRVRNVWLMKHGMVEFARIVNVEKTTMALVVHAMKYRRYLVSFTYKTGGRSYEKTIRAYGPQAIRAVNIWKKQQSTRIVLSRLFPGLMFWIDGVSFEIDSSSS